MERNELRMIACLPKSFAKLTERGRTELLLKGFIEGKPFYKNSIEIACCDCGEGCWLGPRGRELFDSGEYSAICYHCLEELAKRRADAGTLGTVTLQDLGNTDLETGENN